MFGGTFLAGIIVLVFTLVNITSTDASRLVKQWDRQYIVQRFGIVLYQGNDLVQSMMPKINSLFGYDEAAKNFKDFYSEKLAKEPSSNITSTSTVGLPLESIICLAFISLMFIIHLI